MRLLNSLQILSPKPREQRAFTLIELLTVIAVIVILAAILLPVLGRVRHSAGMATSANNLRQWSVAALSFAQDNRGHLPPCYLIDNPAFPEVEALRTRLGLPNYSSWDAVLAEYVGLETDRVPKKAQEALFRHPNDAHQEDSQNPPRARRTYAMAMRGTTEDMVGRRIGFSELLVNIQDPSGTILFTERPDARPTSRDPSVAFSSSNSDINNPQTQQLDRQSDLNRDGMFHYAFVDGHVSLMKPEDTVGSGNLSQPQGMWTIAVDD